MDLPPDVTDLLRRAQAGDPAATDALFTATYGELRRLARARLRRGGRSALLDTSSLVHESYLRFVGAAGLRLQDRREGASRGGEGGHRLDLQ